MASCRRQWFVIGAAVVIAMSGYGRAGEDADERLADEIIWSYYRFPDITGSAALELTRSKPEVVRRIFESRRPEDDRFAAYQLYVRTESPEYKALILKAAKDRSERIRATAVRHIPKAISGKELVAEYVRLLKDRSSGVRYNTAEALAHHPSEDALEPLVNVLADESIEVRGRAADTLLMWRLPSARKRMRELRDSPNPTVAGVANCALARFGEPPLRLSTVHTYLQEELKALRGPPYCGTSNVVSIILVLAKHGDASSLPTLQEATRHAHGAVRDAAIKAIQDIQER